MTAGDRAMAALLRGRALAEELLLDTFVAYAPGAEVTKANGLKGIGYAAQYTTFGKSSGRPRALVSKDPTARSVMVGDTKRPVVQGGLVIPMAQPIPVAGDFGFGWEFECTAVHESSDPNLIGRRYLVVGVSAKTYQTARRLDVVILTG